MTTLADAAYFAPPYPQVDGWLVYLGGDTPNPVTVAQMAALPGGYRVPVFVRSNPGQCVASVDVSTFLARLKANGVPTGVLTVLDLETAVDPAYVNAFGAGMHAAGYFVLTYGSSSTLFANPKVDGWFVADYTGTPHIWAGTYATQYQNGAAYDLDDITSTALLWNMKAPAPTPKPPAPPALPATEGKQMIVLETEGTGGGVWLVSASGKLPIDPASVAGVLAALGQAKAELVAPGFIVSIPAWT